jgi:DNA primase
VFSEDIISRVRDSIDIIDLISGYVSLKKTGKNQLGLCPFHSEKTPSFNVNPEKQIFHCFGCGVGGDVFKFLELQEGLNFPEAVKQLAARGGIPLPADSGSRKEDKRTEDERKVLLTIIADAAGYFQKELEGPAGGAARAYLEKRGVTDQVVQDFALGFARPEWDGLLRHLKQKGYAFSQMEKAGLIVKRSEAEGYYDRFRGRIIFPIRDISGNVIAFGGRVMDDSLPKYLNSSETPLYSKSNTLYCFDRAKDDARKRGYFIIVEGYLDAIACHQFGATNAVATLGTALTDGHLKLIRRFTKNIILIFDPDPAGIRATIRGFDPLVEGGMKVNVVSLPDGDDPDTFFQKHGKQAFDEALKKSVKLMDFVHSAVVKIGAKAPIDERMDTAKEMVGFIEKIPDRNIQNYYIKKIIDALDIDEASFRQERFIEKKTSSNIRDKGIIPAPKRRPQAEETLIHLMLKDAAIALSLKDQMKPEDFTDPLFQRAAKRIFSVLDDQGRFDAGALLRDGDEELKNMISHYSVLEMVYDDQAKSCSDCIDLIKQKDPEKKMKLLLKAIDEAAAAEDWAEYRRLLEEQSQLGRRAGRRIPGMGS